MKYAKYLSETAISTKIPKAANDSDGNLVIGDLTKRPDVLRLLRIFPLVESDPPSEQIDGCHYEKRYKEENETVVEYWISVEDPPAPPKPTKVYSKLKILMAAKQAGFLDPLIDLIESDREISYIWNASNTIEDNELLGQYIDTIGTALDKTEEEIMSFLDTYCTI